MSVAEETPERDLTGKELGDYRVLRRIGRGAMADVYLAEQTSLRRSVALKVLKRDLARDASYVRRFEQEAQAAASLIHPNIVQIYHVGQLDGLHFIAQEYVHGQNLMELVTRSGALSVDLAMAILRQAASALWKAAQAGIVHRDVKPENILVGKSGEVKVTDFGLARVMNEGDALNLTRVGQTLGTPLYMSPEQAEGKRLDPRSDLYSLGVTLFHCLAGRPPFEGDNALVVALQHLKADPERLENIRPDLPPALCRIVHTMLAKDPNDRYPTARELLVDLRSLPAADVQSGWDDEALGMSEEARQTLADRHQATLRLSAVMKTAELRGPKRGPRWPWVAGLAACVLVGAAIGARSREPLALVRDANAKPAKKETAELQLFVARLAATPREQEAGYKAVQEYFPGEPYWVEEAELGLVRLYARSENTQRAAPLVRKLIESESAKHRFSALVLAADLEAATERNEDAARHLTAAATLLKEARVMGPARDELDRVRELSERLGSQLTPEAHAAIQDALRQAAGPPGSRRPFGPPPAGGPPPGPNGGPPQGPGGPRT